MMGDEEWRGSGLQRNRLSECVARRRFASARGSLFCKGLGAHEAVGKVRARRIVNASGRDSVHDELLSSRAAHVGAAAAPSTGTPTFGIAVIAVILGRHSTTPALCATMRS